MKQLYLELTLVFFIVLFVVCASLFQTVSFYEYAPKDAIYPLVHGYAADYYWYLSLMQQGKEGFMRLTTRYSPETFTPQFVNSFFALSGLVGGALGIWTPHIFLLLRIGFGVFVYIFGYGMSFVLFRRRQQRILSLICMVIAAPFWYFSEKEIHLVGEIWSGIDPIVRNAYLPHHMASSVFTIIAFLLMVRFISSGNAWIALCAGACVFVASWFNPASIFVIAMSYGFAILLAILQRVFVRRMFLLSIVLAVSLFIPLYIYWIIQNSVFPWTAFRDWEQFNSYPFDVQTYIGSLGIIGVIAFIGIISASKKKELPWNFVVGWFVTPIVSFGILQYILPISNSRFLQGAYHIPAGLLAADVIWSVTKKFNRMYIIGCATLVGLFVAPSFIGSVQQQMRSVRRDTYSLQYSVPDTVYNGIQWLGNAPSTNSVVMAPSWISTMIPAFTNKRVIIGHPTFTYNRLEKERDVGAFYAFNEENQKQDILKKYGVRYVWIEGGNKPSSSLLDALQLYLVYQNPAVSLYEYGE